MEERELSWSQYDADAEDGMNGTESSISSNSSCSELSTNWIQSSQRILEDFERIKRQSRRYHNHDDFFNSSKTSNSSSISSSSSSSPSSSPPSSSYPSSEASLNSIPQQRKPDNSTQLDSSNDTLLLADQYDPPYGSSLVRFSDRRVGLTNTDYHPSQPQYQSPSFSVPQPSDSLATSDYLSTIIKKYKAPVVYQYDQFRGKAIFANTFIPGASRIWTEHPLVAIQHSSSKTQLNCCEYCFLPLCGEYCKTWTELCEAWQHNQVKTSPKHNEFNLVDDLEIVLDRFGILKRNCGLMGPTWSCVCGESYCSTHCRDKALDEYHVLLCPRISLTEKEHLCALMREQAPQPSSNASNIAEMCSPAAVFHAYKDLNDECSLIAKLVARIICEFIRTGDLESARKPVDMFHKHSNNKNGFKSEEGFQSASKSKRVSASNVLSETHQLVVEVIRWSLRLLEEDRKLHNKTAAEICEMCSEILSFEFFIAIFEIFDKNAISMEIDHPFLALIDILDPHELVMSFASSKGHGAIDSDENLGRVRNVLQMLPSFRQPHAPVTQLYGITGSALFLLICTLNHSCEPNVAVLYSKNGDAHVVAVRDVAKGEELCISYVDLDVDMDAQEVMLRDCDVECGCARCGRAPGGCSLKRRRLTNLIPRSTGYYKGAATQRLRLTNGAPVF
uniref:Uncharacterized protein AlNc14C101G6039 n=1 Tax=Albugo laibachii Nc14 TaxID=890382 RepID=F0WHH6_9STRA|nr:conserved hypothetical protein [Albugo laibachii Nc14]|eukprot:CCA20695.1 conserved hypothetical protein [Albugo laibachii Nc14]